MPWNEPVRSGVLLLILVGRVDNMNRSEVGCGRRGGHTTEPAHTGPHTPLPEVRAGHDARSMQHIYNPTHNAHAMVHILTIPSGCSSAYAV